VKVKYILDSIVAGKCPNMGDFKLSSKPYKY
jgi:hypothetical protein